MTTLANALTALVASALLTGCGAGARPLTAAPSATSYSVKAVAGADAFPALGKVVQVDFGSKWDLHFTSMTTMTYTPPGHPVSDGEQVKITVTPIRPGVFMVTWQESDNTTVTHVEDYQNGIVYTNISTPDGKFYNKKGSLKLTNQPA